MLKIFLTFFAFISSLLNGTFYYSKNNIQYDTLGGKKVTISKVYKIVPKAPDKMKEKVKEGFNDYPTATSNILLKQKLNQGKKKPKELEKKIRLKYVEDEL